MARPRALALAVEPRPHALHKPRAALPWLMAALGCGGQPAAGPPADANPVADPPPAPPIADKPPTKKPTKPAALPVPGASASGLHMVARRYGPLRLQRLALDQLAIRGDLALALLGGDGHFHRAEHDLADIDLETIAELGDIWQFGGHWPDRTFLVGSLSDPRTDATPTIWRRVFDARYLKVDNSGFDGATPLAWEYKFSAPWPGGETVALRLLSTLPDVAEPDDADPAARDAAPVRAFIELVSFARDPAEGPPPTTPSDRPSDAPDSVPNPAAAAPTLLDDPAPTGPDDVGLLPTAAAPPVPADSPPAPSDSPAKPVPADSKTEPAPADSKAARAKARPPAAAPPLVFPKLPRELFPRDLVAAGGSVYVMGPDGAIQQASPRPKSPGRWRTLPATDLPAFGPDDFVRMHAADSGALYVVACVAERPALKRWDGAIWHDEALPSTTACPRSVAEGPGGVLWLATAPAAGTTLWQRPAGSAWTGVDLPRIPWVELTWTRWYPYIPPEIGHAVWERDSPPGNAPSAIPEIRASEVVAHAGAVWIVAYAPIGRAKVPHFVLSTRQPPSAMEFPADAEEGLDAEDRGDVPFDETCTAPFLHLRDLADEEHGVDVLPPIQSALGPRPEFADTVLVEVVRRDGRRQLGAIWTDGDALDEGFGPLGELGQAIDKLRPEVDPVMLCLLPRVRYGLEVRAR